MTVIKTKEGNDVFEDVIKVDDRIERFTIEQVDRQIARNQAQIVTIQAEIDKLNARKQAALALN